MVVGGVVLISFSNIGDGLRQDESSILFAYLNGIGGGEVVEENSQSNGNSNYTLVVTAPLEGTDFSSQEGLSLMTVSGGNSLVSSANPLTFISQSPRQGEITYQVEEGDTPSTIAASFGVTTETLLWANNLSLGSYIRPGDELIILPVSGVLHQVKPGESISGIAKKYKADSEKILSFNALPANGQIQTGQTLVVPDGVISPPKPKPQIYAVESVPQYSGDKRGHIFPWGYCTWYVAQKRYVPWSGHAKSWLANARAYGFLTGSVPQVGAIVATRDGGWYGHVAYVEAVRGNQIVISEMNIIGFGVKSVRVLPITSRLIKGYIY